MSLPKGLLLKFSLAVVAAALLAVSTPAHAQEAPYPAEFRGREIEANGVTLRVRVGGPNVS